MKYVTDGVHLYEVRQEVTNYGLLGGSYLGLLDVSYPVDDPDEDRRLIMADPLEVQILTDVQAA